MHNKACHFALALLLSTLTASAETQPDQAPPVDAVRQLQLAEQKSRLIETLIATPAMQGALQGKNPEAQGWVNISRTLLEQARTAMRNAQPDEAIEKLDEALRSLSKASGALASDRVAGLAARKKQFAEQVSQLDSYRRTLEEMVAVPRTAAPARRLISELERMAAAAQKLFDEQKVEAAIQQMTAAYNLAVGEISRLRDGQEVVHSLNFASPREEFDYEQKRYHSNEILVGMLSREGRAQGETGRLVAGFLRSAGELKEAAATKAAGNDYPAAIKDMEKANQHLNRALQLMGVAVF